DGVAGAVAERGRRPAVGTVEWSPSGGGLRTHASACGGAGAVSLIVISANADVGLRAGPPAADPDRPVECVAARDDPERFFEDTAEACGAASAAPSRVRSVVCKAARVYTRSDEDGDGRAGGQPGG